MSQQGLGWKLLWEKMREGGGRENKEREQEERERELKNTEKSLLTLAKD